MLGIFLALPTSALYGWAAFRQWQQLRGQAHFPRIHLLSYTMLAAILHLAFISLSNFSQPHINFEVFQVASLISWIIVLLLIFSSHKKPIDNLFIGLLPLAAVLTLTAALNQNYMPLKELNYGLAWHILFSILAYSILSIAAVQAVLLYLQDNALKNRQTQGFIRSLPPLQIMDKLLFEMLWLGMLLLTASYLIGLPYISDLKDQQLSHKVLFALISWGIYAGLLFGRYCFGWRGAIASRLTIIASIFMLLSYFGSKFVLEVLLKKF